VDAPDLASEPHDIADLDLRYVDTVAEEENMAETEEVASILVVEEVLVRTVAVEQSIAVQYTLAAAAERDYMPQDSLGIPLACRSWVEQYLVLSRSDNGGGG